MTERSNSTATPAGDADVIVIGGGPAGSAVSTILADAGVSVLVLEKERFPRFKIGESLIPATYDVLKRIGMIEKLKASHFPQKHSVQFFNPAGRASAPFYFRETVPGERSQTWQVLRSELDAMLLDNAREHGVEVREGAAVKEVLFEGERAVGVRAEMPDGVRDLRCRVVVDASGPRALLARQLKLRHADPVLKMVAVFSHFEGAHRDSGIDEGATLVLDTEGRRAWFWYIPLPDDKVSVGVVGPVEHLVQGRGGDPQQVLDEEIARCPGLVPKLARARQAMEVKVINDYSYVSTRTAGDGWVLAGDAYAFLDPIYSTGFLLALRGAEFAADAIIAGLAANDLSGERLGAHDGLFRTGLASFRGLVYAFYDKRFSFSRFLRQHPEHRLAIIDVLVGDVFDRDFAPLFRDVDAFLAGQTTAATAGTAA